MKVSATEEHGLRCLMHLAEAYASGRIATISEIATARGMSPAYVAKMIAILRRGGLVRTVRGSRGGLRLARPPEEISVAEAMRVLSGQPVRIHPCVADDHRPDCGRLGHCHLREVWKSLDGHLQEVLGKVTLSSLAAGPSADWKKRLTVLPSTTSGV